ncbi:MAG: acylphosphatase [Gemmatimonadota bacterium]
MSNGATGRGEAAHTLRRRYRVRGRVQGVGFRWWVQRTAQALGLSGWVRNMPDGSVRLEAAGAEEALDALEEALLQGPPLARVTAVEREAAEAEVRDRDPGFRIVG